MYINIKFEDGFEHLMSKFIFRRQGLYDIKSKISK